MANRRRSRQHSSDDSSPEPRVLGEKRPTIVPAGVEAVETLIWLVEANATRNLELREARKELAEAISADTQPPPIKL